MLRTYLKIHKKKWIALALAIASVAYVSLMFAPAGARTESLMTISATVAGEPLGIYIASGEKGYISTDDVVTLRAEVVDNSADITRIEITANGLTRKICFYTTECEVDVGPFPDAARFSYSANAYAESNIQYYSDDLNAVGGLYATVAGKPVTVTIFENYVEGNGVNPEISLSTDKETVGEYEQLSITATASDDASLDFIKLQVSSDEIVCRGTNTCTYDARLFQSWSPIDWDEIEKEIEDGADPDDVYPTVQVRAQAVDTSGNYMWTAIERYTITQQDSGDTDIEAPEVTVTWHERSKISPNEEVDISVVAIDDVGVDRIDVLRNGTALKSCENAEACDLTVGPFSLGESMKYEIMAYDEAGNVGHGGQVVLHVYSQEDVDAQAAYYDQFDDDYHSYSEGDLVRSPVHTGVYLIEDGKRRVFPNQVVFFSWYDDFLDVRVISAQTLEEIPQGDMMTVKPGEKLMKFHTTPSVYFVRDDLTLEKIESEEEARELAGEGWVYLVVEVLEMIMPYYTFYNEG